MKFTDAPTTDTTSVPPINLPRVPANLDLDALTKHPLVQQARIERELQDRYASYRRISEQANAAERAAAFRDLKPRQRSELIAWGDIQTLAFIDGMSDDDRDLVLNSMTRHQRTWGKVQLMPATPRIKATLTKHARVRTDMRYLAPAEVNTFMRAGLESALVRERDQRHVKYNGLHFEFLGYFVIETAAAWAVRLEMDHPLARFVADGTILVEPLPDDESRAMDLREHLDRGTEPQLPRLL